MAFLQSALLTQTAQRRSFIKGGWGGYDQGGYYFSLKGSSLRLARENGNHAWRKPFRNKICPLRKCHWKSMYVLSTTKKVRLWTYTFLVALSQWCNPCTCANTPAQPARTNLPTWLLPTRSFRGPYHPSSNRATVSYSNGQIKYRELQARKLSRTLMAMLTSTTGSLQRVVDVYLNVETIIRDLLQALFIGISTAPPVRGPLIISLYILI